MIAKTRVSVAKECFPDTLGSHTQELTAPATVCTRPSSAGSDNLDALLWPAEELSATDGFWEEEPHGLSEATPAPVDGLTPMYAWVAPRGLSVCLFVCSFVCTWISLKCIYIHIYEIFN